VIALDTNIIVRLIVDDDAEQVARARRMIESGPVVLSATVLLETEWVLRSSYGVEAGRINAAIRRLCGLGNVHVTDEAAVDRALDLHARGFDFADALHLAATPAQKFATFDRRLKSRAARHCRHIEVIEP